MIKIDFTQPGGFPLEQHVLDKLQQGYSEILRAFVKYIGLDDTSNYVISGCQVSSGNITAGYLYMSGDLCYFPGVTGTVDPKIIKAIVTTTAPFESGSNLAVYTQAVAQVNASGALLSTFTRLYPVYDQNYVHTDNNFTSLLLTKLNGIESNAEVNVQADWADINPLSDSFIKNKPLLLPVLKHDSIGLGNFPNPSSGTTATTTVTFPSVGTDQYIVFATLKSRSTLGAAGQDCVPVVTSDFTPTSFKIIAKEFDTTTKNTELHYLIIAKP
ncbi:MAG: hypothetical protein JST78_09510 [Bacteroidetes bacterium]|nr:hypothetical protein [Bacteroidota bacterium]